MPLYECSKHPNFGTGLWLKWVPKVDLHYPDDREAHLELRGIRQVIRYCQQAIYDCVALGENTTLRGIHIQRGGISYLNNDAFQ